MKKALTVRLSPEARDALERLAAREGRSMSSWVEWTIRQQAQQNGAWRIRPQPDVKVVSE